jgi:hypothetical protein
VLANATFAGVVVTIIANNEAWGNAGGWVRNFAHNCVDEGSERNRLSSGVCFDLVSASGTANPERTAEQIFAAASRRAIFR